MSLWMPSNDMTWQFQPLHPYDAAIDIVIVDVHTAEKLATQADFLVSLWGTRGPDDDPGEYRAKMAWARSHPNSLVMEFDDIPTVSGHGYIGVTEEQVKAIIAVAPGLQGRVAIHCAQGVARSTAAALVILVVRLGSVNKAIDTLELAIKRTEEKGWRGAGVKPNKRVIALADHLLGLKGKLIQTVSKKYHSGT